MEKLRLARAGPEVVLRVLGVDAALDGVAADMDVLLGEGQGQPRGHPQLLLHQVHPGNQLGDGVLHLDAGVHLDEIELPLGGQDELHRPRPHIARGFGGGHGGPAHLLPQLGGQGPGGGLLDQLLAAALDGAVPLPQVDHVALAVRHDLKFNVPGGEDQLLQIHLPVAKAGDGLGLGSVIGALQPLGAVHLAHSPSAAAGRRLQQHGIAHLFGQLLGLLHVPQGAVGAGDHRHPRLLGQGAGGGLAAHFSDHVAAGADVLQPRLYAPVGKVRVLRQKAIAGVDGVAAGGQGRRQDGVLVQIAVRRPGGTHAQRPGGDLGVEGALVGGGIDAHRLDVQLPAGPDHPQGDLSPVGDQHALEHSFKPSECGTAAPQSPRPRRPGPGPPPPRSRRGRGSRSSSSWPR